jgi:hypothetical protein
VKKVWLIVFLLLGICSISALAQDPGDQDSVYLVCNKNGYFGSGLSQVTFSLRFKSDNTGSDRISSASAILRIESDIISSVDTTTTKAFDGSAIEHFDILSVGKAENPDPSAAPFLMVYGGVTFYEGVSGESLFFNVVLNVNDTGIVCIDTLYYDYGMWPCPCYVNFITQTAVAYRPHWPGRICCKIEVHPPGDVNLDHSVNVTDIVAQVGYLFRNRKPESVQAADVNGDCGVTLGDIFYLANHIFKSGEKPLVGCVP